MTEPPQFPGREFPEREFPTYADRPQDDDPAPHGQQQYPYQQQQYPYGQPYGGGPAPYGYPAEYGYGYPAMQHSEPNSMALAALISGGIGLGPLALGLGIAALFQIRRTGESGTWMAWTGIVLGALVTLLVLLFVLGWVIALSYDGAAGGL